jgi:hypothetical protein
MLRSKTVGIFKVRRKDVMPYDEKQRERSKAIYLWNEVDA